MRLLLDTHVLIGLGRGLLPSPLSRLLDESGHEVFVSVATLWEIAFKVRLGKLQAGVPLEDLEEFVNQVGIAILPIEARHALTAVVPVPPTRDPFDRMLLAQCSVERLKLVTVDRALASHPLAWSPEQKVP